MDFGMTHRAYPDFGSAEHAKAAISGMMRDQAETFSAGHGIFTRIRNWLSERGDNTFRAASLAFGGAILCGMLASSATQARCETPEGPITTLCRTMVDPDDQSPVATLCRAFAGPEKTAREEAVGTPVTVAEQGMDYDGIVDSYYGRAIIANQSDLPDIPDPGIDEETGLPYADLPLSGEGMDRVTGLPYADLPFPAGTPSVASGDDAATDGLPPVIVIDDVLENSGTVADMTRGFAIVLTDEMERAAKSGAVIVLTEEMERAARAGAVIVIDEEMERAAESPAPSMTMSMR